MKNDESIIIGAKIKQQRAIKGWTQKQLSDFLNISRGHLIKIERGSGNPTLKTILKLKDLFGCEYKNLLP